MVQRIGIHYSTSLSNNQSIETKPTRWTSGCKAADNQKAPVTFYYFNLFGLHFEIEIVTRDQKNYQRSKKYNFLSFKSFLNRQICFFPDWFELDWGVENEKVDTFR